MIYRKFSLSILALSFVFHPNLLAVATALPPSHGTPEVTQSHLEATNEGNLEKSESSSSGYLSLCRNLLDEKDKLCDQLVAAKQETLSEDCSDAKIEQIRSDGFQNGFGMAVLVGVMVSCMCSSKTPR